MALGNSDRALRTYVKIYQKNERIQKEKLFTQTKFHFGLMMITVLMYVIQKINHKEQLLPKKGFWFEFIRGIITKVLVDDKNKFGTMLELTLVDEGKEYQLSVNVDGIYGRSLAERISGLSELGKFVKITPYFKARDEKTGQERELQVFHLKLMEKARQPFLR